MRRRRGTRSLGRHLVRLLSVTGLVGALAITLLLTAIITPNFDTLEARGLAGSVARLRATITATVTQAGERAHDRAVGRSRNGARLGEAMAWIDGEGRLVALSGDSTVEAGLRRLLSDPDLIRWMAAAPFGRGYVFRDGQVSVIGWARPQARGPTLLLSQTVRPETWARSNRATVRLMPPGDGASKFGWSWRTVAVRMPLIGPDGRTVAVARFDLPRDMAMLGRRMLLLSAAGSTLLLLGLLLVLRRAIARHVIDPLARVERHMQQVRASGMLTPLDDGGRRDEIGALTTSLNAMLAQLRDLHERIAAQGFALGRSESAVAVMHNVRNALNPISTILSRSSGDRAGADPAALDRAVMELARPGVPAERRERLAAFVAAGLAAEARDRARIAADMAAGRAALAHVLEVIGAQQAEAHERPPLAPCDIAALVARQAQITVYASADTISLTLPAGPVMVRANRLMLSQVLGNLIGNAVDAIVASGRGGGKIAVTVISDEDERFTLVIRDDGVGFRPDDATTLFRPGYSTRSDRRGGLGLHWCANAMAAMEGALELRSAGPGHGAEARLTLPRA